MSLNKGKTEIISFGSRGKSLNLEIKLRGKVLVPTIIVKYLGIYLDEFLSGEAHYQSSLLKKN